MKRMRGMLVLALTMLILSSVGLAAAAQTKKKTTSSSSANKTVFQQVSSATSSFFKGVVDTVTLKKFTSTSTKSTSTKK